MEIGRCSVDGCERPGRRAGGARDVAELAKRTGVFTVPSFYCAQHMKSGSARARVKIVFEQTEPNPLAADFLMTFNAGDGERAYEVVREGEHGMRAHRGVLQPDEWVDDVELRAKVEQKLGFTVEQVHSVYRQGPLSSEARALRDRIDARVLEIVEAGGHAAELGAVLGFPLKADGSCRTIKNALVRARGLKRAESTPIDEYQDSTLSMAVEIGAG